MSFYEALVAVMDERDISVSDICEKTGFYPSYISKLKSGHTKDVTWEKALAIIDALGMTPSEFYEKQLELEHPQIPAPNVTVEYLPEAEASD